MKAVEIIKVEKNTELAGELIRFVKDFSWNEVKKHLLETLRSWTFTDRETPFAAIVNGHIVGMAYFMKKDYYPLPEIYP